VDLKRRDRGGNFLTPGKEAGDKDSGQAMVEFAFTVPLIIILFVSVVGFSFLLYFFVTLNSCAREGARYVIGHPQATDTQIATYVRGRGGILNQNSITVTVSPALAARQPGANVTVSVAYPFQIVNVRIPYVISPGSFTIFPPITLNAASSMNMD
jgi:hypothetical protein